MSSNDKKPIQKVYFSSSLSESDSSSGSEDWFNQKNPNQQSRILDQDSNSNFLYLNNHSTTICLGSNSKDDITKKYDQFKCENIKNDISILSPVPDKIEDESLEDESIQDLVSKFQENIKGLYFKGEEEEKEKEESLKMLGKKRKKLHNSEIDSDSDSL